MTRVFMRPRIERQQSEVILFAIINCTASREADVTMLVLSTRRSTMTLKDPVSPP